MRYLLDTNILSDLVRNPRGKTGCRLRQVGESAVLTSIIAAAEARFGVAKSGSNELAIQLARVLQKLDIAPFEAPSDQIYAEIRAELERQGKTISGNDYWIAAHALALDCTLVTANERDFRRVPGLKVENWLA
jgi:tRNA(fMet)-specific endonuclease VapC